MIKLSNINKTLIKKKHTKWFTSSITPKLNKYIKKLELENNISNNQYITFLKKLKSKKNLAILSNKEMLELITEFHKITLPQNELEELKKIFDYDSFSKSKVYVWDRHKLINNLNIKVCPYCQRNYITSYIDGKIKKTTADLDHFYSKDRYPFLALSLYNFIPSCPICNSRMKLDKSTYNEKTKENRIIYPYIDNFKGVFKTNNQLLEVLLGSRDTFEVSIDDQGDLKTKETIDMFKLDKVYKEAHNEYLLHMMESIKNKPESYLKSIAEFFIKEDSQDKEELEKVILANLKAIVLEPYRFKIENGEPLAKLTQDILKEFDIEV